MGIYQSIKNFVKKPAVVGLVALLSGCVEQERVTSIQYVDLNNDSQKEIVCAKYEGLGLGDSVWGIYENRDAPRKLFTLKRTDTFRFEDMDGDGFPELVFEVYSGWGLGDSVWDVYSVKNDNGQFGESKKIAGSIKKKPAVVGLVALLSGCVEQERVTSIQYVDLNNDSQKEIVCAKYEGLGLGDSVWGIYENRDAPRKLFTLKRTDTFRFEDMDGDGFPELVFEVYSGWGLGDSVWDVYSVKNDNGQFGESKKIAGSIKKKPAVVGLGALLGGCVEQKRATSKIQYVDLNNDSQKEIVYAKYEGLGLGDSVWGIYENRDTPRKLFTLKRTDTFRFEDMDGDGFPELVFEVYSGWGLGDSVWDVYSVKNDNGQFGEPKNIARSIRK